MSKPPPILKLVFGDNIVTPLAQVTVVDGDKGDCNVVDFCRLATTTDASTPPKTVYQDGAWRRTIIDTGPAGGQKATNIVATLTLLATQQCYPALATDPTWSEIPVLDELQITHPDDDHIGNAKDFLTEMCKAANIDKVRKCNVVYSHIPELYEQPTITEDKPVAHKYNMNKCTYTASVSEAWQTLMEKSGFEIMVNLYPQTPLILAWTLRENNAQWDENTRYGLEGPTCTLYYKETAVDTGLKPELEAQVTILLPEQGNLRATATEYSWKTKTETKYGWESTVSMDKTMNSLNRKVPMNKDQEELGLEQQAAFDLEWIPSSLIKQKKAPFMLPSKLMSDMVIRQPLAGTANVAVEAGEHIIGSVRQVSDLSTKITKLNQSPINARLKTVVPEAKQIIRPTSKKAFKTAPGYQYTIGPTEALYKNMMRTILLNKWALDAIGQLKSPGTKENLDSEDTNRSSIVTMFERHDKDPDKNIDANFSMLFTGDAYDKACDIRDTLVSWQSPLEPTLQVDVLKIPHHGSDVSTSSGFYRFCRAYVYLVCGSHCNQHGNPKLSMLEAIVKGFYGKSAPGNQPFRIFFSNPNADVDWISPNPSKTTVNPAKSKSAVLAILANPYLKPSASLSNTSYYYEMYKLKSSTEDGYAAFGQILLGKDGNNNFVMSGNSSQWERMEERMG